VVLVTGATSGIGQATALAFQRAGAQVLGTGRRAEAVDEARSRHPQLAWLVADVTSVDDAERAVEAALRLGDRLDVLVNNAGIFARARLENAIPDVERALFATNVFGTTNMSRAAVPHLIKTSGSILNVSSAAAHRPAPGIAH